MNTSYENVKQSLFFKRFTRTAGAFETALWNTFDAADWGNKEKLGYAFPIHLNVYKDWYNSNGEREFFKDYLKE